MNDRFAPADAAPIALAANDDVSLEGRQRLALYLAVGLAAGAVIALQIDVMRVFSVGSWAHFGSLVVSLAMLGFGLTSAMMCVAKIGFRGLCRAPAGFAPAPSVRSPSPPIFTCNSSASTPSFSSRIRRRSGSFCRFSWSI